MKNQVVNKNLFSKYKRGKENRLFGDSQVSFNVFCAVNM